MKHGFFGPGRGLLLIVIAMSGSSSRAEESSAKELAAIDTFALSGVGVVGTPFRGETIFRSVLAGPCAAA